MSIYLHHVRRIAPKRNGMFNYLIARMASEDTSAPTSGESSKLGGFAKAFERHSAPEEVTVEQPKSFAALLRNSKFVDVNFMRNIYFAPKMTCFLYINRWVIQRTRWWPEKFSTLSKMICTSILGGSSTAFARDQPAMDSEL